MAAAAVSNQVAEVVLRSTIVEADEVVDLHARISTASGRLTSATITAEHFLAHPFPPALIEGGVVARH